MTEDEEVANVDLEIYVGGSLKESILKSFVKKIARCIYQEQYTGRNLTDYLQRTEEMIHTKIRTLDNDTLFLFQTVQNGEINPDFIMFCIMNNLSVKVRTAPYVNHNGQYMNELITLYLPGHPKPILIPTDGETKPTTLVEDVFTVINDIFNEYEKPDTDAPKYINDRLTAGDVARRKLAGEDLRKILTDCLASRISYPDQTLPPFKVIKGV